MTPAEPPHDHHPHGPPGLSFGGRLRAYFLAGILITAPLAITFGAAWFVVDFFDRTVAEAIPLKYNPNTYLPFSIPGLGLMVVMVGLTLTGALTAGLVGRLIVRTSERVLDRMPVIRNVYSAVKQIFETVLAQKSTAFRQVVLIEYPRRGIWAIGFVSGTTEGEVQNLTEDQTVNVFLPTTPNPTSGFLLFVPRKDMVVLNMSVEEGIKMVVSGGIVTPPDRRPEHLRNQPVLGSDQP
ncbi:DUF502 domain-containing protein [Roseospirillum parvum]|uniref:Uncharacterized membrane protein n=1 Tax=Roseospirillum parvum TaxID=83401 RepID=A0A1G7XTQ2_9PROT|nr:DUF502 domain-containing protein [Roseospirillum parvum]SDG87504.1 Uncharacterized membrane protein [Roseospirillum parvum]